MAAVPDANMPRLVDLRQVRPPEIETLLEEETAEWEQKLDWDFRPSADLVRRFVRMQALSGYALVEGANAVGYGYYVFEDRKGLIGDLYVMQGYRAPGTEQKLLNAVLEALHAMPHVHRVESQLMMLSPNALREIPFRQHAHAHSRNFMVADLSGNLRLPASRMNPRWTIGKWIEDAQEPAARLIARAYEGHIDSEINDQYRTVGGARRFLMNIVQYPGCGSFFQPASCVAFEQGASEICGISLASLVAFDVGHITQICVDPNVQGEGVGYALLRYSLDALVRAGCRCVSLTVTTANAAAVQLYERTGFQTRRVFDAMVWDDFAR